MVSAPLVLVMWVSLVVVWVGFSRRMGFSRRVGFTSISTPAIHATKCVVVTVVDGH